MRVIAGVATGVAIAATLMLAGCQTTGPTAVQTAQTQQSAPSTDAAAAKVEVPLDVHQASARCWMKFDSNTRMTLDQKAEVVDKCIDETMRAQRR
jgi:uncharacterized lipoprotein YajG